MQHIEKQNKLNAKLQERNQMDIYNTTTISRYVTAWQIFIPLIIIILIQIFQFGKKQKERNTKATHACSQQYMNK